MKFLKKIFYFLSFFNWVKCANCKWDSIGDPYCKPPLGLCIYEENKRIRKSDIKERK